MKPEKTYYCEVDIKFGGNSFEAKSKEEYIKKVKNSFKEEFNIELKDNEIKNIKHDWITNWNFPWRWQNNSAIYDGYIRIWCLFFFKKILTYILGRRRGENQMDLTYFYFSCNVTVSTEGKNMKAIMYVSLLWVVLGVLISFVAV